MAYNKKQFRKLIIETLTEFADKAGFPVEVFASESAVDLLMLTAAVESDFGTYLFQMDDGPAVGAFQMEPLTAEWIWNKYFCNPITTPISRIHKFWDMFGAGYGKDSKILQYDLRFQIIMARLRYWADPEPLPMSSEYSETEYKRALASTWKRVYNTEKGHGTVYQAMGKYNQYVAWV